MNRLKLMTGVILIFLVGFLAGAVIAGLYFKEQINDFTDVGPPESARIRMLLDRFSHDLNLSDTQKTEIEKILHDVQDEIFQLTRQTFPEVEKLNDKGLEQIKAVLDSDQREKFNGFQDKMRRVHDRLAVRLDFPGKSPAPDIDELKKLLALSSEQESKIKKIRDEGFRKREQIMKEDRKKDHPDFSKIRQEVMESEDLQHKRIEEVLTAEQMESYEKYMEERRPGELYGHNGRGHSQRGGPVLPASRR